MNLLKGLFGLATMLVGLLMFIPLYIASKLMELGRWLAGGSKKKSD